jgi:hypothetical protein
MKTKHLKYSLNESYFNKIDDEQKAYFLGLLASDGCITDSNKVLISLVKDDSYLLESLKKVIDYTGPLYELKKRTQNHKDQIRLQLRSFNMYNDLNNLGVVPRKSLILKFPTEEQVPKEFQRHFIRGYFDGDGSTKIAKGCLYFRFVGTYEFLSILQNIIIENCNINKTNFYQAIKSKNTFELTFGGDKQCIQLYDFMYNKSSIQLERKKEKARIQISQRLKLYSSFILEEELQRRFTPKFIQL